VRALHATFWILLRRDLNVFFSCQAREAQRNEGSWVIGGRLGATTHARHKEHLRRFEKVPWIERKKIRKKKNPWDRFFGGRGRKGGGGGVSAVLEDCTAMTEPVLGLAVAIQ
jgi:hypothetical protein